MTDRLSAGEGRTRIAVVLHNLGGPDSLEAVAPFLRSLFSDPAIIGLPQPLRGWVSRLISARREPEAREIYARLGGRSPILAETLAQAEALAVRLRQDAPEQDWSVLIAMRHSPPDVADAVDRLQRERPDRIVLCPLFPQFSTTTTGSFLAAWQEAARAAGLEAPTASLCCYPVEGDFIAAHREALAKAIGGINDRTQIRVLFSAHGLPKRVVEKGDPYQWQVERTAEAVMAGEALADLDWRVCYQSRVGPLAWIGPETREEITAAASEGRSLVIVPIAFVSEHSETLVELDMDYATVAQALGVRHFIRVPTLSISSLYIASLARMVRAASTSEGLREGSGVRLCPSGFSRCPLQGVAGKE